MSRRAIVVALLAVGLVIAGIVVAKAIDDDGTTSSATSTKSSVLSRVLPDAAPAVAPFTGLTEVRAAIDGRCLRLVVADSEPERVAGLRGNEGDLGPYDGMLFVFDTPTVTAFTMSDVDSPLEIGFFRGDGAHDSSRAMAPCPDKAQTECPVYRPGGPFTYAVETKPGDLPSGALGACQATT